MTLNLPKQESPVITNVMWSSVFRIHSAVADQFVKHVEGGTVVLLGDAAHVHR